MSTFREKIREKIADESLQAALDANAQRRVQARETAYESIPDWRERRQRARSVRADVIAHLDDYLNQFLAKLTENGFTVHRAKDADEANQIALELIKNSSRKDGGQDKSAPRLIAKSK